MQFANLAKIFIMLVLLRKEIRTFFSSATGPIIIGVFLLLTGSFIWLLPGAYNVLDSGYASLDGLFLIAPWVYLFLIPALTMRMFSEEYRTGTMELLLTKPVSRWSVLMSKFMAGWILVVAALIPTLIYLYSVCLLGVPVGNIDFGGFWGSFLGLILLASVYVAIGVCASSLTDNPIVSFILSAFVSFLLYVGFDSFSELFTDGRIQELVSSLGIASHYDSMSRGVIDTRDLVYFLTVSVLFIVITWWQMERRAWKHILEMVLIVVAINVVSSFFFTRFDLTTEKRYTLSDNTKELMGSQQEELEITIYLDGDMNKGFLRLKKSVRDILEELNVYAVKGINYKFINPSDAANDKERNMRYAQLEARGMKPTVVYDKDNEGRMLQKVIFPWAECVSGKDTVRVNLLKNISGKSGEENLNVSIETLEYEFTDAIRVFSNKNPDRIAFIEGHGEWDEAYVYDITKSLSKYYYVDRGMLGSNISDLEPYKVIIIASPIAKYTESEKFIIDQYIMNGGRVLWLVDGVRTDKENIGIANDVNLDDQLFTYGVRIDPVLLLDQQCALVPMNVSPEGQEAKFEAAPWYYAPLLLPSAANVITKNTAPVRSDFTSIVELVGEEQTANIKKSILLASSNQTGVEKAPMPIRMDVVNLSPESPFFAYSYLPVAVLLEGSFKSVFANRMIPQDINMAGRKQLHSGNATKMIVVADGDIIRNDIQGFGSGFEALPLGYDRYMDKQFGNGTFVLNAINYLADDEGWMSLRGREWKLRLLDKQSIRTQKTYWQFMNMGLPIILLIIFSFAYQLIRKKQYS